MSGCLVSEGVDLALPQQVSNYRVRHEGFLKAVVVFESAPKDLPRTNREAPTNSKIIVDYAIGEYFRNLK